FTRTHAITVTTVAEPDATGGTVTSTPSGIACNHDGTDQTGTCSTILDHAQQVTLTATPHTGSYFVGWTGGSCTGTNPECTITVSQAESVTATFRPTGELLTVTPAGNGSGTITSSVTGINCTITDGTSSGICSAQFPVG